MIYLVNFFVFTLTKFLYFVFYLKFGKIPFFTSNTDNFSTTFDDSLSATHNIVFICHNKFEIVIILFLRFVKRIIVRHLGKNLQ